MNTKEDDLVYDEDEAVEFIYSWLSEQDRKTISKDDIDYVLDVIYDYYESEGLIDEDSTEEASIDEEKMYKFVQNAAKKDKINLSNDAIQLILEGEYEYGVSTGIYEEE